MACRIRMYPQNFRYQKKKALCRLAKRFLLIYERESYHIQVIFTISRRSRRMIRFSSREIYDWDIPK